MSGAQLLICGLNPALQSTLHFDRLRPGAVNRARRRASGVGGKGQNCALAAVCLSAEAGTGAPRPHLDPARDIALLQPLGGHTGAQLGAALGALPLRALLSVPVAAPTRVCTTLLCAASGAMTELIEPAGALVSPLAVSPSPLIDG
jgi:fructose-1-phosphate kinase PfkB-like protein